jgi:hypothetical protein
MGLEERFEMQVLPEFVPISKFHIVETFIEILFKSVKIDIAVIRKVVRKAVVSPVAITEKDKPRLIVKGNHFGLEISPV